jgi:hypothetical protein
MYPFYAAGLASSTAVMVVGHVLMTPAMVVAMLFRLDEYTGTHKRHTEARADRELVAQTEG